MRKAQGGEEVAEWPFGVLMVCCGWSIVKKLRRTEIEEDLKTVPWNLLVQSMLCKGGRRPFKLGLSWACISNN